MAVDLDKLTDIAAGEEVPKEKIEKLSRAWVAHKLRPGEVLWKQGELANSLGLLRSGELQVIFDGQDIGTIRPGQIFGEATAFSVDTRRTATLQSVFPAEVLLIERESLSWLRAEVPAFYDRLLGRALETLCRRVRVTDSIIANLSKGEKSSHKQALGGLESIRRAVRKIAAINKPDPIPLLESLPHLRGVPPEFVEEIASQFKAEPFERGQLLAVEGEPADSAFLLGSGKVRITREVYNARAEELVVFEAGSLFGIIPLIEPGPRTASCVGTVPGWIFTMDHLTYRTLPSSLRIIWKESLASSLSMQLRIANELVARFLDGGQGDSMEGDGLRRLAQAAGVLEGVTTDKL